MNEEEKRAIEEYQRHTLECINYLVKTAESVGIEGVNEYVPISVETCAEIMRRLDAKVPRWIPVSERKPNPGEYVLCAIDSAFIRIIIASYDPKQYEYWDNGVVLAWMPLPEYKEEK